MIITDKLRAKILVSLPKRYAKTVAESCKVSEQTVYSVLHHKQDNLEVAKAIIKLAADTKQEKEKAHKSVDQLVRQL